MINFVDYHLIKKNKLLNTDGNNNNVIICNGCPKEYIRETAMNLNINTNDILHKTTVNTLVTQYKVD